MELLEEVKQLDRELELNGFKSWSYARLTVDKIIKLLETGQLNKPVVMQAEGTTNGLTKSFLLDKLEGYIHKRDGYKEGTQPYGCYDLLVREFAQLLNKYRQEASVASEGQGEANTCADEMCGSDCCPGDGRCEHCRNPIRKSG